MASRSFFSRHPFISFFIGLILLAVVVGAIWIFSTPREDLIATGKRWVVPDLQSIRFEVGEVTPDSVRGQLSVRINNRLPATITVDSIQFTILLDDDQVVTGASRESFRIPARTDDDVHIPLHANIRAFSQKVRNLRQDSATIRIQAVLFNRLPGVGTRQLPVEFSRRVPIPQFPEVAVQSTQMSPLGPTGGELRVQIQVKNRNSFPIIVNGFSYRFQLGTGVDIQNKHSEKLTFQPGTSSTTIPIRLQLKDIQQAINELLTRGGNTKYRISGTMHVRTNQPFMEEFNLPIENEGALSELINASMRF